MKSSIIAIIVVAVVIVGGVGYVAAKDPGIFALKSGSNALPETSPGTRIVSPTEVNQSMSGHWIEVLNITVGISNLSSLMYIMGGISDSSHVTQNLSDIHVNYAQAAAFVSSNHSAIAMGYASFSSIQYANITNRSIIGNITNEDLGNISFGITDGSFYAFEYARTDSNYTAAFYDLYSNYLIIGVYHGAKNRTLNDFTGLAAYEISILNSYKLNFSVTENLVSTASVQSDFAASYKSIFNMSAYFINPADAYKALGNYSEMLQGSTSSGILNMTDNGSSISGIGLEAYHSNITNSTLALGYLKGTNSSFASQIYRNVTTSLNLSLEFADSGRSIMNRSYDGMTFFVLNISLEKGTNITFSVGVKGDYLVASAVLGPTVMDSSVISLMQNESSII